MQSIIARNLGKTFRTEDGGIVQAMDGLDVSIPKGSIVGLLGPNGAGKTTTIRMLSTIYRPTTGGAMVNGYDIITESLDVRKSIGVALENHALYTRLSAERNLRFYADLYDVPKEVQEEKIESLLREFDLYDAKDRAVGTFSKGMTQKLSISKALIHDPDVLMLDEPWSGLSPTASKELREKIAYLATDHKRTILISTHNLAQVEKIVDRFIFISKGRLVLDAQKDELLKKYNVKSTLSIRTKTEMKETQLSDLKGSHELIEDIAKIGPSSAEFQISDIDHTPELVRLLVRENYDIMEVREVQPSLEEIYFNLVEE